jgi:hypothetical protein
MRLLRSLCAQLVAQIVSIAVAAVQYAYSSLFASTQCCMTSVPLSVRRKLEIMRTLRAKRPRKNRKCSVRDHVVRWRIMQAVGAQLPNSLFSALTDSHDQWIALRLANENFPHLTGYPSTQVALSQGTMHDLLCLCQMLAIFFPRGWFFETILTCSCAHFHV